MGFHFKGTKTVLPSLIMLGALMSLGACQHDRFSVHKYQLSYASDDTLYCENLARSVQAQYDPKADPIWFYEFGSGEKIVSDNLSHYANYTAPKDVQFVDFTALSLYDIAYQHQGLDAVIALCLERRAPSTYKTDIKMAYHTHHDS